MTTTPHANNNHSVTIDTAIRTPIASRKRLELPVVFIGPPEIETRIKARRDKLIASIVELRADTRPESVEARRKLKLKLSRLAFILREAATVSGFVKAKLDDWLATETD